MSTEDEMLRNSELNVERMKVKVLRTQLDQMREFANWMAGAHDFEKVPYFIKNQHLLNQAYLDDTVVELPIRWASSRAG